MLFLGAPIRVRARTPLHVPQNRFSVIRAYSVENSNQPVTTSLGTTEPHRTETDPSESNTTAATSTGDNLEDSSAPDAIPSVASTEEPDKSLPAAEEPVQPRPASGSTPTTAKQENKKFLSHQAKDLLARSLKNPEAGIPNSRAQGERRRGDGGRPESRLGRSRSQARGGSQREFDPLEKARRSLDEMRRNAARNGSYPKLAPISLDSDLWVHYGKAREGSERPTLDNQRTSNIVPRLLSSRLDLAETESLCLGVDSLLLRDACQCHICVDPSSKQKNFQTTDLKVEEFETFETKTLEDGKAEVTWGKAPNHHVSVYSPEELRLFTDHKAHVPVTQLPSVRPWNSKELLGRTMFMSYTKYMTDDKAFLGALTSLSEDGILILKDVPKSELEVETIGGRIGVLRDTFYGRTWDVKSVPEAKNVAYTQVHLGLHQDLLYMHTPPGFQLLHCLKNTCEGGTSLFSDSFRAVSELSESDYEILSHLKLTYRYVNDGQSHHSRRNVIDSTNARSPFAVNYSPPFQGALLSSDSPLTSKRGRMGFEALQRFANLVESKDNLFEYRLQEGDCVIFNNRRILHGRTQFDAAGGERWLKGTYIDLDTFRSKFLVLQEQMKEDGKVLVAKTLEDKLKHFEAQQVAESLVCKKYI